MDRPKRAHALRLAVFVLLATAAVSATAGPWKLQRLAPPAELQRGELRRALTLQDRLQPGDRISTGAAGRVALVFAPGTELRLGGESTLEFAPGGDDPAASLQPQLLSGALRLRDPAGALPLLALGTLELHHLQGELWAELAPRGTRLCLLSGSFELLSASGVEPWIRPGSCEHFGAGGRRLALPGGDVLQRKLQRTAFAEDAGPVAVTRPTDRAPTPAPVTVVVASYLNAAQAEQAAQQRRDRGIDAAVLRFETVNGPRHRLIVGRHHDWLAARAALQELQGRGEREAWLSPLP